MGKINEMIKGIKKLNKMTEKKINGNSQITQIFHIMPMQSHKHRTKWKQEKLMQWFLLNFWWESQLKWCNVKQALKFSKRKQKCVQYLLQHTFRRKGKVYGGWVCFTLSVVFWDVVAAAREEEALQSLWSCPASDTSEDLEVGQGCGSKYSSKRAVTWSQKKRQGQMETHVSR